REPVDERRLVRRPCRLPARVERRRGVDRGVANKESDRDTQTGRGETPHSCRRWRAAPTPHAASELLRREIRRLGLDRLAIAAVLMLVIAATRLPRLPALFAVRVRERDEVALVHHVAVPVEDDALVHHERRGNEVGLHTRVTTEVDGVARLELAVDLAFAHPGRP